MSSAFTRSITKGGDLRTAFPPMSEWSFMYGRRQWKRRSQCIAARESGASKAGGTAVGAKTRAQTIPGGAASLL